MSRNCDHDECEPYDSCQAATEYQRRQDFWWCLRVKRPTGQLGTDPLAWLSGDVPDK